MLLCSNYYGIEIIKMRPFCPACGIELSEQQRMDLRGPEWKRMVVIEERIRQLDAEAAKHFSQLCPANVLVIRRPRGKIAA